MFESKNKNKTKQKLFVSMDITFSKNESFFKHTYLQRGIESSEDQFWQIFVSMPNVFFLEFDPIPKINQETQALTNENEGNSILPKPSVSDLQTGREILLTNPNTLLELRVFSRNHDFQKGKDHSNIPVSSLITSRT